MTVTKDKNFIIIEDNGKIRRYDFSQNVCYGIRGAALKTIPPIILQALKEPNKENYHLFEVLSNMIGTKSGWQSSEIEAIKGAEYLDSIQLQQRLYIGDYIQVGKNIKEISKAVNQGLLQIFELGQLLRAIGQKKRYPDYQNLSLFWHYILSQIHIINYDKVAKLLEDKYNDIIMQIEDAYSFCHFYDRLISLTEKNNLKLDKTGNAVRQFVELSQTEVRKKEQYDEEQRIKWKQIYEKYSKIKFSNDEFEVVFPEKPQDLVTEGMYMHHCVGGYIKEVLNGTCLIVFVRKKNEIDKPYITAQIYLPTLQLGQYYLSYDRNITEAKDFGFRTAFCLHLEKIRR